MFESLQEGLGSALRTLTGKAKLTEANMRDGLHWFNRRCSKPTSATRRQGLHGPGREQAVGEKVLKSLNPSQQIVGIVHQRAGQPDGPGRSLAPSEARPDHPDDVRLAGLGQNDDLRQAGPADLSSAASKPMLVAADLQRPAAVHQLQVLGEQLGVPVYAEAGSQDPVAVCQNAVKQAREAGVQVRDSRYGRPAAHRRRVDAAVGADRSPGNPDQVYLVVDAMTGQDAVNSAKAFNEALELDGVIMTKLDGDARGGAALSVKAVTGVPLKLMGTGEHLDALEEFHPDRMAGRILGMGDVVSLVEQARQKLDQDEMAKQEERLRQGRIHARRFPQADRADQQARPLEQSGQA